MVKLALSAALVAVLVAAPAASAQDPLFNDFRDDGQIEPCDYSAGQLQDGLNNLPPDIQQYAPGFGDQLRAGLETQCGGGGGAAPGVTSEEATSEAAAAAAAGGGSGGGGPGARIPKPPAPDAAAVASGAAPPVSAVPSGTDVPGWLVPLLAGLTALLIAGLAAGRFGGFAGERMTSPLRAAFADLGGRTADTLATAADLLRFGR